MQNVVPASSRGSLALRSLAERHDAYVEEVEHLVRAGMAVMRRRGTLDPRVSEIVAEANLSNQAFYRHFHGKDELLLAILDDGLRQLVDYLEHRMAKERTGTGKVRTWVEGVLAQAANAEAAEATRPFALNGLRLSHQFPEEVRRSEALLTAPLRDAIQQARREHGATSANPARDAETIYHLAMGRMEAYLARGERPSRADVQHLVAFVLAGLERDT